MKQSAILEKTAAFDRQNREAARIVLADPLRYPPGCGLHQWAELVIAKYVEKCKD